jgi:hypothetical protein
MDIIFSLLNEKPGFSLLKFHVSFLKKSTKEEKNYATNFI